MVHAGILTVRSRAALRRIGPLARASGFYLGGGTAVALHLGHRRSADFDWFSPNFDIDAAAFSKQLRDMGIAYVLRRTSPGTLDGAVSNTKVTFLHYPYPDLAEGVFIAEFGCKIASLDDLACMKLSAISQRGARKDFLDLYTIILRHRPLGELISLYKKKYEVREVAHVLYGLTYFDSADEERGVMLRSRVPWKTVKSRLLGWTRRAAIELS